MIKIYHEYHELSWKLTIFDVIQSHCVIKQGDTHEQALVYHWP